MLLQRGGFCFKGERDVAAKGRGVYLQKEEGMLLKRGSGVAAKGSKVTFPKWGPVPILSFSNAAGHWRLQTRASSALIASSPAFRPHRASRMQGQIYPKSSALGRRPHSSDGWCFALLKMQPPLGWGWAK